MSTKNHQYAIDVSAQGIVECDAEAARALQGERKTARIRVADYAREHGMNDPDEIAQFAADCVVQAERRIAASFQSQEAPVLNTSIRIAAERWGLGCGDEHARAMSRDNGEGASWVPVAHERKMPEQPLGELVTAASPRFWRGVRNQVRLYYANTVSKK